MTFNSLIPRKFHLTQSSTPVFLIRIPRTKAGDPQPLGVVDPEFYGTTGLCLIPEGLRYVDSNRVWVVPFFHAFYYGVLKRLFELTFPVPGAAPHPINAEFNVQFPPHLYPEYVSRVMVNFPEELEPSLAARKHVIKLFGRIVSSGSRC